METHLLYEALFSLVGLMGMKSRSTSGPTTGEAID